MLKHFFTSTDPLRCMHAFTLLELIKKNNNNKEADFTSTVVEIIQSTIRVFNLDLLYSFTNIHL